MNLLITPLPADFHTLGFRARSSYPANLLRLATTLIPLTLLVACGGGGSGGRHAAFTAGCKRSVRDARQNDASKSGLLKLPPSNSIRNDE